MDPRKESRVLAVFLKLADELRFLAFYLRCWNIGRGALLDVDDCFAFTHSDAVSMRT